MRSSVSVESEPLMHLRLFRLLCIVATVLNFFVVIPANHLLRVPPSINLAAIIFGGGAFFFYRESCRGRYHITSFFFLFMLHLNLIWFVNGASQGSVSFYFFVAFVFLMIFFQGRVRWLLLAAAIVNVVGLIAAESHLPQWVVPYHSQSARMIDLITALTASAISCSLMLWVVLSSYDREQQRLMSLNSELERNMAERTQAEKLLHQNRELLNAVIEGTSDAIYAKDTQGRYILFNSAAARITGKSVTESLGNDDTVLFSCDDARVIMKKDREVLSSGEIKSVEHEITNSTGERITVQSTKGPLRDDDGNIVGVFGISRDVTEHRRVVDEIRKLNEELDLRVQARTVRLQAAVQEQESFSYSVSHDLRAPLRHINCYSAMLEEDCGDCLTPEARGYLERIRNSSRKMGQLIDDLLELSRIGRSDLVKDVVDLSELASAISCKLQEAEPHRCVQFVIAPGLTANGDPLLLAQVLENLFSNSWKYSSHNERSRIELGRGLLEDREVYFVRDDGVGFDMAYKDKLFGAFQRLHGTEFEGTGIGLATVKRIIERHDGRVWAEAAVNEGATFYFTLGRNGAPSIHALGAPRTPWGFRRHRT